MAQTRLVTSHVVALAAITQERHHQLTRFDNTKCTASDWCDIARNILLKAEQAPSLEEFSSEMRQLAAVACSAMEEHGVVFRGQSTTTKTLKL